MTHTYNITGLTCNGCVNKAKSQLLKIGSITAAHVQLDPPQAAITMQKHIPVTVLQEALHKAGDYAITEANTMMPHDAAEENKASWFATYKPILLIGAYISGLTLLIELFRNTFGMDNWMQNFMAAFFLVFSFFKMLDLTGFAENYATYDIIAKKWRAWGVLYAFIELALGIAYLLRLNPLLTNGVTFLVMCISITGVMQSVFNKKKIQCACLGVIFKLPMSTITIIEDTLMIIMSAAMIVSLV